MAKRLKKIGRPTLSEDDVRNNVVQVRLQNQELASFKKSAEKAGLSLSEWMRQALKSASKSGKITP